MGGAVYDHFVTNFELFDLGVMLFAEAFVGLVLGQYWLTLKDQLRMTDNRCCAHISL